MLSRLASKTVNGVNAYERTPTRLENHPRVVRVFPPGLVGSMYSQMYPVNLEEMSEAAYKTISELTLTKK